MPPRLLLYVPGLQEGGSEKRLERIARGLAVRGFDVTVGYSNSWGPVGDRIKAAGIPVLQFPFRDLTRARHVIAGAAPEVFHSFSHKNGVDIAGAHGAGVPAIAGSRVNIREWDEAMQVQPWEHERNRMTHHVCAVSEAAARVCHEVEGVPRHNIRILHSGVPIPAEVRGVSGIRLALGIDSEAQTIGYVANYRPEKDHEMLLRAFARIVAGRPKTHLICCGIASPEREAVLRGLAADLTIESRVSLLGSHQELAAVYGGLDVYVHSSRFEGFSNSLLEAMAYGLPVVATDAGGNPEAVVDGETGAVVPRGDADALADATVALLADEGRRRQYGRAGRERVERYFSLTAMLEGYAAFYEQAARPRPALQPCF
jgi:glycosyltransferase involved in cell wall biosynthesis